MYVRAVRICNLCVPETQHPKFPEQCILIKYRSTKTVYNNIVNHEVAIVRLDVITITWQSNNHACVNIQKYFFHKRFGRQDYENQISDLGQIIQRLMVP